jgi:hypothetical protein
MARKTTATAKEAAKLGDKLIMLDYEHTEQLSPDFVSKQISLSSHRIVRVGGSSVRWYCHLSPDNEIIPPKAMGITSFANVILPKGAGFMQWLKTNGMESENIADEKADYGTLMHVIFSTIAQGREVVSLDRQPMLELARNHVKQRHLNAFDAYLLELQKSALQFASFCIEREVVFHGIELSTINNADCIADTKDFIVEMLFNGKRVKAIIDAKSSFGKEGKKQYFDNHLFQLFGQRRNLAVLNPEWSDCMLFNYAPTNFTGTTIPEASQALTNQTTKNIFVEQPGLYDLYVQTGKLRGYLTPQLSTRVSFGGDVALNDFDPAKNIRVFEI